MESGGLYEEVLIRREIEEIVQLNCADWNETFTVNLIDPATTFNT